MNVYQLLALLVLNNVIPGLFLVLQQAAMHKKNRYFSVLYTCMFLYLNKGGMLLRVPTLRWKNAFLPQFLMSLRCFFLLAFLDGVKALNTLKLVLFLFVVSCNYGITKSLWRSRGKLCCCCRLLGFFQRVQMFPAGNKSEKCEWTRWCFKVLRYYFHMHKADLRCMLVFWLCMSCRV